MCVMELWGRRARPDRALYERRDRPPSSNKHNARRAAKKRPRRPSADSARSSSSRVSSIAKNLRARKRRLTFTYARRVGVWPGSRSWRTAARGARSIAASPRCSEVTQLWYSSGTRRRPPARSATPLGARMSALGGVLPRSRTRAVPARTSDGNKLGTPGKCRRASVVAGHRDRVDDWHRRLDARIPPSRPSTGRSRGGERSQVLLATRR